jgi:MFS transporter, UMF1 family
VIGSITNARTQQTVVLNFTGPEIAKLNLAYLVATILGSVFAKTCALRINALNAYRLGILCLSASIVASGAGLRSPDDHNAAYGYFPLWGFFVGWIYPCQRVLYCTLIPKGQENEMMGIFTFTGQIIGWLPSVLFTVMNENHVDQWWGLCLLAFFYFLGAVFTLPMGSYERACAQVEEDSRSKLDEVVRMTTELDLTARYPVEIKSDAPRDPN